MASDNPFCSTSLKEAHLSFTSSSIVTMSLTCVLDLSVNISILAVSCNAFAVLFNSRAPVCAFVLIPERLIAIDFSPLPIRAGSCNAISSHKFVILMQFSYELL